MKFPQEVLDTIIYYTGKFELAIRLSDYAAMQLYDPYIHTWQWAIENEYLHVLRWFLQHHKCIHDSYMNHIEFHFKKVKNEKIIKLLKTLDVEANIKLTLLFNELANLDKLVMLKQVFYNTDNITGCDHNQVYPKTDDMKKWLAENFIDCYYKYITKPKTKSSSIGIELAINVNNDYTGPRSLCVGSSLYVSGDLFVERDIYVKGAIYENYNINNENINTITSNDTNIINI